MIIINAVNLSSGGALSILRNVYLHAPSNSIFLIKNSFVENELGKIRPDGPKKYKVNKILQKPSGLLFYYGWWVDNFCKKHNAELLISLGNIASRTKVRQKLYIHWPYFAYGLSYNITSDSRTYLKRVARYYVINSFSSYASTWVVQTNVMKNKLFNRALHKSVNIQYIYPGFEHLKQQAVPQISLKRKLKIFYPSLYYSHKNFEFLYLFFDSLSSIERSKIQLTLTLPDKNFKELGFSKLTNVYNLGILPHEEVMVEYTKHDALIMPTLLETFGLPYLEAMSIGLPILSANKDFAIELCGDYAVYFDPTSIDSLKNAIISLENRINNKYDFKLNSQLELNKFPTWKSSVKTLFS